MAKKDKMEKGKETAVKSAARKRQFLRKTSDSSDDNKDPDEESEGREEYKCVG